MRHRTRLEAEVLAESENARSNRAECGAVQERAAATQIELQNKVITLEEELRATRRGLAEAQEVLASAGKLAPEVRKLRESSWRLRQDLAAAERVRVAARIVAGNAEAEMAECAMDGNLDAMDEVVARNRSNDRDHHSNGDLSLGRVCHLSGTQPMGGAGGGRGTGGTSARAAADLVADLAEQMAAMQSEMSAMQSQHGDRAPSATDATGAGVTRAVGHRARSLSTDSASGGSGSSLDGGDRGGVSLEEGCQVSSKRPISSGHGGPKRAGMHNRQTAASSSRFPMVMPAVVSSIGHNLRHVFDTLSPELRHKPSTLNPTSCALHLTP